MKRTSLNALLILTLLTSAAWAQGSPLLAIDLDEEKINLTQEEQSGDADVLYFPGDTIRYNLVASNVGDGLMTQPEVVDPIPAGVSYIAGTAQGQDSRIVYSIDTGASYHNWPVTYTVRNANGDQVTQEATADMITNIKWQLQVNLQPGDSRLLQFMVEVR